MADVARVPRAGGSSSPADAATPRSRRDIVVFGAILIFLIAFPFIDQALGLNLLGALLPIGIYALLAMGLNIVVGYAGLLDLGYAAFFAIGAYTAGMLSSSHISGQFGSAFQISFWLVIWIAAAVAAIFGIILGAPTLPLRGDYLAIVTLGFGEIVPILLTNLDAVEAIETPTGAPLNLTGGDPGISAIAPPSLPIVVSLDFSLAMFVQLALAGVLMYGLYYIVRRILEDERAEGRSTTLTRVVSTLIWIVFLYALFYGT